MNLKDCPFCGEEAKNESYINDEKKERFFVSCSICFASTCVHDTPEAAAEAWNMRA